MPLNLRDLEHLLYRAPLCVQTRYLLLWHTFSFSGLVRVHLVAAGHVNVGAVAAGGGGQGQGHVRGRGGSEAGHSQVNTVHTSCSCASFWDQFNCH